MYAIINAGGTQFKVQPGMEFEINRLDGAPGDTLTLDDQVLMVKTDAETLVGSPAVANAAVDLEILEHFRGKKIVVFKMKRRKRYRRKQGHRQELTRVRVKDIRLPDGTSGAASETPAAPPSEEPVGDVEPAASEE